MQMHKRPLTLNQIADRIATLETSNGKNDKCQREHLGVNAYGYGQRTNRYMCFDSDEHARKIVKNWFALNLMTMSLNTALCRYNIGTQVSNCEYAKKFQSLK